MTADGELLGELRDLTGRPDAEFRDGQRRVIDLLVTPTNNSKTCRELRGAWTPSRLLLLLLDDMFGSGWTLTEVGRLLRRHGSGVVYPGALASSAGRQ